MKTHSLKLVEKIDLPNNLVLEFYDYSRVVAGDRWLVGLLTRIPIEISEEDFAGRPRELYKDFLEEHGTVIYFELKKDVRLFWYSTKDLAMDLSAVPGYCCQYLWLIG